MKPSRAKQTTNKGEKNNYVHSLQNASPSEASLRQGLQSGQRGKQVPPKGAVVCYVAPEESSGSREIPGPAWLSLGHLSQARHSQAEVRDKRASKCLSEERC